MASRPLQFKPPSQPQPEIFDFPLGYTGGINISTTADLIAKNQSPDMVNMNYDKGVPCKRYGFDRVNSSYAGSGAIKGQFEYEPTFGTYVHLIARDGKLWSVAADGTETDLCTGTKTSIADAQVDGFVMNGKFYFLTGTEYCYYDGTNPVAVVVGKAPLIFTGLAPNGTGGTALEQFNFISDSWKLSYSGTAGTTEYSLPDGMSADSIESIVANGVTIDPSAYSFSDPKITFDTAPGEGTDNVVIQPTKSGLMDATVITKCRFHALYGGKDDTRVFFSGNPDISNGRYRSGLFDPTYFPENGEDLVGADSDAINGMGRAGDYLITYKEINTYYTDLEAADTTITFPTLPMSDEYGCCSWRTVFPAQNGLLALTHKGVTWTKPIAYRGQLNTDMISKSINRGIGSVSGILQNTVAEREAAWAYVWDNKYILHVGSTAWVLDLDYSNLAQGVYCWYPYTGLFATLTHLLARNDSLLYAGDSTGKVYKSNEEYRDGTTTTAIDGYWTSPMITGSRNHMKRFENLHITYGNEAIANHNLYIISEDDVDDVTVSYEDTRAFNFDYIDFDNWTFGTSAYPEPQTEKLNLKAVWVQWKIQNDTVDQGLTILNQALTYSTVKELK